MAPIITLTSDFGLQDHSAAIVKGQLLQHVNALPNIIDVTHQIACYNLPHAAYSVHTVAQNFPANTFHCVLVNLFETNSKYLLCFKFHNQFIFSADNGFVNLIKSDSATKVYAIPLDKNLPFDLINFVQTMAKCINWIYDGNALEDIGEITTKYLEKNSLKPIVNKDGLEGYIIFVDQYENVVTNITKSLFNQVRANRKFKIVFKRDEIIEQISESYGSVIQGEKLALFNSSGLLEIAINQGNAAGLFGLLNYAPNSKSNSSFSQKGLYYQTVKIYFEE
jgi:S-adenosyl-L-methionine hydrolase (adenosine-forming)